MSKSEAIWKPVDHRRFSRHEKFGGSPSMKVEYVCGPAVFPEWIAFENDKAKSLCAAWWRKNGGAEPTPEDVTEALKRATELRPIGEIRVEASGKYWRVTGQRFGETAEADEVVEAKPVGNLSAAIGATRFAPLTSALAPKPPADRYAFADLDDDIPF
jgi:DNA repair protein RadD